MTRIRYTEKDGVLTSKPMVAGDKLVIAVLNTVENWYQIKTTEGEVLVGGKGLIDVAQLKKAAKTSAMGCGVVFQDEVRRRGVEAQ